MRLVVLRLGVACASVVSAPAATAFSCDAASPTTEPGSLPALEILADIPVENEHQDGYDRSLFPEGIDADADGCDTRAEVLIRDTISFPQLGDGCAVSAGEWLSIYDNATVTDATGIEIDHVVSLKEAWDSGAWQWDQQRRNAFANDLDDVRTLRAVTPASNEAKGDADPSNWIPTNEAAVCQYLADWVAIKARWTLSMDQSEAGRIRNLLTDRCPDQAVAPWPTTDRWVRPLAAVAPTTASVAVQPLVAQTCDTSYPNVCIPPAPPDLDCGDVSFRRFDVLPPDPHGFDGDHDGVGCEG